MDKFSDITLSDKIHSYIAQNKLMSPGQTVVIGLSGGPDSACLTHLLAQLRESLGITLIAAHLDHGWRTTSADDALWCKQLAESLNIPFVGKKISELNHTIAYNGSKEAYARSIRRYFFKTVAEQFRADAIAMAHHAQDQEETFFIRLARGATLSGLTGMKAKDGIFIRPLLQTNKTDILAYLCEHNLSYRLDETNESHDFLRNRIRMSLMPQLDATDARMRQNLARTMEHLAETEQYLQAHTRNLFLRVTTDLDGSLALTTQPFFELVPYAQKRILIHFLIQNQVPFTPSEALLDEILRFMKNKRSLTHALHASWNLKKQQTSSGELLRIVHI